MTAPDAAIDAALGAPEDPAALLDPEEIARRRALKFERWARWALPLSVMILTLVGWQVLVWAFDIKHYILPGPIKVAEQMAKDWDLLWTAAQVTMTTMVAALAAAVILGVGIAVLFTQSRVAELCFYPYAVILQVTPVITIAPLILIYVDDQFSSMLICAWIVAFFPILSNTTLGLNSVDHNLRDLFQIYGATRWQKLVHLQLPAALPYFLGGLRIAGGLSLIGAVVAEFAMGTGGRGAGLAFTILEASYRLVIPRMFAALVLIGVVGVAIFAVTSLVSHLALRRWHESALKRES